MRNFFLLLIFSFSLAGVHCQTNFDLKKINKNQAEIIKNEKEIDRLSNILVKEFMQKASDSSTQSCQQIRQFFSEQKKLTDKTTSLNSNPVSDSDISISVIHYNYSWNFTPVPSDSLHKLEGYRNKELDAIVSVPLYTSLHKGYEVNSISFFCKLSEVIHWTEDENNLKPIEQLPGYSKTYNLKIKKMEFDN